MKGAFVGNAGLIRDVYAQQQRDELSTLLAMDTERVLTKEDVLASPELTADTEYLFSTWGMPIFSEEEIRRCFPKVKALFYAAGTVQSFARPFLNCGIRIFSAWTANAVPVAEYATAQILLANKGYFATSRLYSAKQYKLAKQTVEQFPGNYGCRVGLLGAGSIGSLVAEMLRSNVVEVLVFDPFLSDERAEALGVRKAGLEEIFSTCQTISNHLANNEQTVGILNGALFDKMKETATFINTGRGAQVVEDDLCDALQARPLATAVLDVTWPEPVEEDSRLYSMDNVVLTPHIAGSSGDEVHRMAAYMIAEYRAVAADAPTQYEVSMKMLETMA